MSHVTGYREITAIRFKRVHIHLSADDRTGHWWFEIGDPASPDSESFGWWPESDVDSYANVLFGVAGILNNGLYGCNPPRDPRHSQSADEEFHPLVPVHDKRTDEQIAKCLRDFALAYSGKWQWCIGWGRNCHTFQREALQHCKLGVPSGVRKVKL